MSRFRPSAAEERWLAVPGGVTRTGSLRTGGWRTVGVLVRCGLFLLGAITAGLFSSLVELLHIARGAWAAALVLLAAAEFLLASRHLFFGGLEEALEAAAAVWLVSLPHAGESDTGLWLMGCALCVVGLRLLNPLFTTGGVAACVVAAQPSAGVCYAIATLALAASNLPYQRPSYDRMLGWLIVVMPIGASLSSGNTTLILVLAITFGCAALCVGIVRRMHAPLLAFLVCVGCVANEWRKLSHLSVEARLVLGGCLALVVAMAIDRYLRSGRGGMTSRAIGSDDDASMISIAALPTPTAASGDKFEGGGGTFSGGGASGNY